LERIDEETNEAWRINENTLGEENPTRVWRNPREGERNHLEIPWIRWGVFKSPRRAHGAIKR
jgi:hypothetical protein